MNAYINVPFNGISKSTDEWETTKLVCREVGHLTLSLTTYVKVFIYVKSTMLEMKTLECIIYKCLNLQLSLSSI